MHGSGIQGARKSRRLVRGIIKHRKKNNLMLNFNNEFDWGIIKGEFFGFCMINEDFCGIDFRIGKVFVPEIEKLTFSFTIQIGYGQLTFGIMKEMHS